MHLDTHVVRIFGNAVYYYSFLNHVTGENPGLT